MNNENLIKKIKNQFFIIINWNHLEVVKEEPQPIKVYIYNEKYKNEFKDILEIALIGKKNEFVDLFLTTLIENDIYKSFLKEFLNIDRLMKLYNNEAVILNLIMFFSKIIF
jgi:hypothetical protein